MAKGDVLLSTPRGKIVETAGGKAQLIWNENITRFNQQYSRAQKWLDNEVLKDTEPYVPADTMQLTRSGQLGTIVGSGTVEYIAPYARYLYYGKVMLGPKYGPKHATNKDLVFSQAVHPQAQAYWFEASKAQNKQKWVQGAKKMAGGG